VGNKIDQEDFVTEGFERLDRPLDQHPPRINWENIYRARKKEKCEDQLVYAQRVAESYHEAAQQIQRERDKLLRLCEKQEQQIQALDTNIRQNNDMLQQEITRMNEERQQWLAESAELRTRVRELEKAAVEA
jgi:ABC-type transporter Mla subunit MlaD